MKKFTFLLIFFYIFFLNKVGFCKDVKSPITIDAEKAVYLEKENKVLFENKVIAKNKDLTIKSDKLIVFLNKKVKNINSKRNKKDVIKKMVASGNVHIIFKDKEGYCSTAEYNIKNQKITLNGNVKLIQNKNKIEGDKLVIDLNKNTSEIFSNNATKVKIIFYPEKQENSQNKSNETLTNKD